MREEAVNFFAELKLENDVARRDFEAIQEADVLLGASLDAFALANYGADYEQTRLQCVLKQFLDTFSVKPRKTADLLLDLQEDCDKMVYMMEDFSLGNNLFCKTNILEGCEAELNELRCQLEDFCDAIELFGVQTEIYLRDMHHPCTNLGKVAKRFSTMYNQTLICCSSCQSGASKPSLNYLKSDIRILYPEFRGPYDAIHVNVNYFKIFSNNLTMAIDTWTSKLLSKA